MSDSLYGVVAGAQIGEPDAPLDGFVMLDGPSEPESAPRLVAARVDACLAEPGHAELALARALHRVEPGRREDPARCRLRTNDRREPGEGTE